MKTTSKKTYRLDGRKVTPAELINTAQHCVREQFTAHDEPFDNAEIVKAYLQVLIGTYEHEVFYALWLNSQRQLIKHGVLFTGTINSANIYPREVIKTGLACNAAAVIFAHNHPSGNPEPSFADITITHDLQKALKFAEIRLVDHLIVGKDVTSMAEQGRL